MMVTETPTVDEVTKRQRQKRDQDGRTEIDISTGLLSDDSKSGKDIFGADVKIMTVPNGVTDNRETSDPVEIVMGEGPSSRNIYRILETPPIYLLIFYALQLGMLGIAKPVTTAVIISEVTCAQKDEYIKTQVLSASFFTVGLASFIVTTFGVRLPIYQNPDFSYLLPLMAMSSSDEWGCPDMFEEVSREDNTTILMARIDNATVVPARDVILAKLAKLNGSLMLVGGIHFIIGCTGLVGILIRFIGPVTIVPTLTLIAMLIYKVTVKMSEPSWIVASLTCLASFTFSLCLATKKTPIPMWSRLRGFYIFWYPFHQSFSVLLSILFGWTVSAIMTSAGALTDDPKSPQYLARSDARSYIIDQTDWFTFPYPGKLGWFSISTACVISCLGSTFVSVLDSIGDYSTCARACRVPPPPKSAFNRGIAVEGLMNIAGGALGCCHPTSSASGHVAALSITKVVSRRVIQCCGLIYILLAVFGKVAAVFITMPYPVLGGVTFLISGLFIGFVMSSLQTIDLNSTRNLAIIGTSIMLGLMLPYWVNTRPGILDTGNSAFNNFLLAILSNPAVVGGVYACLLDNIIPGSLKARGLLRHMKDLDGDDTKRLDQSYEDGPEVYRLPFIPPSFYRSKFVKYVPIFEYTGQ